jgi:hypothetical protein
MDTVEAPPRRRGFPKWLIPASGYTLSAVSLIWVFWKFPFAQLSDHLRTMQWNWVAAAVLIEFGVYFMDAWRWQALLKPVGDPSFGMCLQAVFVGVLANDILPAKAGEVVRCFLLSYETDVPLPLSITSDFIIRIMDGLWIPIVYLIITLQIPTHVDVSRGMWVFTGGAVAIALLLLFALFRRQHAHRLVRTKSWAARFHHLLDEVHRLGKWPELRTAMLISGLYWLLQVLAIWALTRADRFDLSLSAAAFVLVVKCVGTIIPNAPANLGTYQVAVVSALTILLVEKGNAQAFAEIMFVFLTIPIAVGGAVAIVSADIDIFALHRHARRAHASQK